ncbi:MAG: DJ-1/PfpI family protein [Oscillospiraceae bacterium]|jgi:4-methyl-5(b-hydroxyethyl)-thiazole monophosphate biosynthesis|nr:DJ-1/PfpI family protein [Oscillospiraceae bacterium]
MVYVFLAEGFEELEALAPTDLLRRAGVEAATVGVGGKTVAGSHGIPVTCDLILDELRLGEAPDGVILPGGPGYAGLETSPAVLELVRRTASAGGLVAAICAAPSILGRMGLLAGREACCFPGYEETLKGARISMAPVVRDGNMITARGAGAAVPFALELIAYLKSPAEGAAVAAAIQCP